MARRAPFLAPALAATLVAIAGAPLTTATAAPPPRDWGECRSIDPDSGKDQIDATCFLEALVDRYQRIAAYQDVARVLQVLERSGEAPRLVETRIGCNIDGDVLRVETPASRLRHAMGLDLPFRTSPAMDAAALRYKIWLAPHMSLRFEPEAQRQFGSGVEEGFTATEAEAVTIDDRTMVHLELKSCDGPDDECEATIDLYVNPDSMLVERLQGQQRLPDGAQYETTVDIVPTYVESVGNGRDLPPLADPAPVGVTPEPVVGPEPVPPAPMPLTPPGAEAAPGAGAG